MEHVFNEILYTLERKEKKQSKTCVTVAVLANLESCAKRNGLGTEKDKHMVNACAESEEANTEAEGRM